MDQRGLTVIEDATLSETVYIRVSGDDKQWLRERANGLRVKPSVYARMLLSKAVELDRKEPGKLLC